MTKYLHILYGVIICIIIFGVITFLFIPKRIFSDFLLLSRETIEKTGVIVEAGEDNDEGNVYFGYSYKFNLPDGKTIYGLDKGYGPLDDYVGDNIKIVYLKSNPSINTPKHNLPTSLNSFLLKKGTVILFLLALGSLFSYQIIKAAILTTKSK